MTDMEKAQLVWGDDGVLRSAVFDDVYFSIEGGMDETDYVFLKGNDLPGRFAGRDRFVIAETGFGTGLNFVMTWRAWQKAQERGEVSRNAVLEYISFEKYPMSGVEIQEALDGFGDLSREVELLGLDYPTAPMRGVNKIDWHDRIMLTLVFGDVNDWIGEMPFKADAWYLDGFSPNKNEGMWTERVFEWMGRLTANGGTISTFTAAGFVRRGLMAAGFTMKKVKGFGKKREMLAGEFSSNIENGVNKSRERNPWFSIGRAKKEAMRALVVGGGIAGCAAAWSLSKRGLEVDVIERDTVASGGSSNLAGLYQPHLSVAWSEQAAWVNSANDYVERWLVKHGEKFNDKLFHRCGVFHPALTEREEKRFKSILKARHWLNDTVMHWMSKEKAAEMVGYDCACGGLMVEMGGWVRPGMLCKLLLNTSKAHVLEGKNVLRLIKEKDKWSAELAGGEVMGGYDVVVVANAIDARQFDWAACLPLRVVRGQLSVMNAGSELKCAVSGGSYILPGIEGKTVVGATFGPDDWEDDVREDDHTKVMTGMREVLPKLAEAMQGVEWEGKVGFRCVGEDRLPMVGRMPEVEFYKNAYDDLKDGKAWKNYPEGQMIEGLYVSVGHGSRGLVSGMLGGELIGAMVKGEALPVGRRVVEAVHPARFLVRKLKRGET
ncbi:bifunctional tRNA (5-methylaminomethyl-2-thiouridine)(34)-methyltransferase MnmD/FAD-dependent 5-carboxymethylaminomethyl-2-thiouridine(34) oxidoreductase MnmC [Poriferisphaera sp. WC338]|uniref:bifunctional tRNA (5-methylaminomethyl-2-thiouridine)(34)-methyltransferase MnmD/FAD-dependent 5-carboxymethylaminomethyl-2-thiouridine(34) oxidoreductase MnmC n=1 Tax=Poriferisphaera sp. WC338 TaxID=3425129 RepID=UPI003D819D20